MGEINKALGAAGMGQILRADGKEYTVLPPTQKSYAEFERWLEDVARQRLEARRATLTREEYDAEREALSVRIDSLVYSWGTRASANALHSAAGQAEFGAILLRQSHPGITANDVLRIIKLDDDHFTDVLKAVIKEAPDPNVNLARA